MEKKNRKTFLLILLGLLTTFGLAIEVMSLVISRDAYTSGGLLIFVAYVVTSLLLLYYAFVAYKAPHGNLMRYLFLAFSACCLCGVLSVVTKRTPQDNAYNIMRGIVVLLTAYVAGRLDHFKQNIIIMSLIGVLMLCSSIVISTLYTDVFVIISCFTYFILWVDLMFAYILRYKEHKEVGLEDKK